jgi:hypothetical protein
VLGAHRGWKWPNKIYACCLSRNLLATVSQDIESALANDDAGAVAAEPVEALAVRFEADHPSLAGVLRQIMDTLGKAGI